MKKLYYYDLFYNLDKHTTFKEDIVIWLGLRALDYKNLIFMHPDAIASTRYGKDTKMIEKQFPLLSAEKFTRERTDSTIEEITPYIESFLLSFGKQPIHIVPYSSTKTLEEICSRLPNVKLLSPPAELKQMLDRKSLVREELQKIGVNCIPGHQDYIEKNQYDKIAKLYGLPFFVQLDNSAAGSGSFKIEKEKDFENLANQYPNKKATFMKFIHGKSININVVRTRDFTVLSEPSLQIIGEPICTSREFGYCGNDFHIEKKLNESQIENLAKMAKKIGNWLGSKGYRGLFGIDCLADENQVYFTEINPRFQGSTGLLIDRQLETGKIPLSFFHLVPYLEEVYIESDFVEEYNKNNKSLGVSQILLRNTLGRNAIVNSHIAPGRYKFEEGKLKYLGHANFLSETSSTDEIVITGDIPLDGTFVYKDADEICKILSYREVLDKEGRNLNPFGKAIVKEVYSYFEFK